MRDSLIQKFGSKLPNRALDEQDVDRIRWQDGAFPRSFAGLLAMEGDAVTVTYGETPAHARPPRASEPSRVSKGSGI